MHVVLYFQKSPKSPTKVPNKSTGGQSVTLKKIYLCPTCGLRFPMPESNPETNFKTNFTLPGTSFVVWLN